MSIVAKESSTVTGSPVYRLKHKWTVKGFAATYLAASSTNKEDNPELNSTWFSPSLEPKIKFRIRLRPRSGYQKCRDSLGLFLEMKHSRPSPYLKSVEVKYKLSLLNVRNKECHSRESKREFDYPSASLGCHTFLKHSELQAPVSGLLPGDQLTILVEVDVFQENTGNLKDAPLLKRLKARSIDISRTRLADLVDSSDYSDVILMLDGGQMAAHKTLLSLGSPVFSAMFKSDMAELKEGKVMIPDMKVVVAKKLVEFIYTGYADELEEYAEELLVAGDKYGVLRLKEQCVEYLCGQVNLENAARLFALADRHSVAQLKAITVKYIRAHWEDVVMRSDEWKPIQDLFVEELRLLKPKEEDKTKKDDDKAMPQEESESTN